MCYKEACRRNKGAELREGWRNRTGKRKEDERTGLLLSMTESLKIYSPCLIASLGS